VETILGLPEPAAPATDPEGKFVVEGQTVQLPENAAEPGGERDWGISCQRVVHHNKRGLHVHSAFWLGVNP
jgi:hypothetical protein